MDDARGMGARQRIGDRDRQTAGLLRHWGEETNVRPPKQLPFILATRGDLDLRSLDLAIAEAQLRRR